MKKIYEISAGFDIELTLEVDLDKLTPELATEINNFWSGSDDVLAAANGDVIEAAVRRAAPILIHAALDGWNANGMISQFENREGWPDVDQIGIRVLSFQIPDIDAYSLDVFVQPSPVPVEGGAS